MLKKLALALVVTASSAQADTLTLPSDTVEKDQRATFRLCRAAILVEDGASEEMRTKLPPATISAMREQITFIMAETIFGVPTLSLEDGQKRGKFTEQFVIEFSRTIGSERERLNETDERERILMTCQPLIWWIMKEHIDVLMLWRLRAMGLDKPFPGDTRQGVAPAE